MSERGLEEREEREAKKDNRDYCRELPAADPNLDFAMNSYCYSRNINPSVARHNFWFPSRSAGDDNCRIVIPATSRDRYNKYWQARYIGWGSNIKRYESPSAKRGDAIIITYPIRAYDPQNLLIVEGPFDALAASMEGVEAIALMGITPSIEVMSHVKDRAKGRNIVLAADRDEEAGMAEVMIALFKTGFKGPLKVVTCAPWKDLAVASSIARGEMVNQWFT